MNLKVKAGVIVASIVAGSVVMSSLLKLVAPYITPEMAFNGVMLVCLAMLLYTAYGIILTKLEYNQKLKEMVDQKSK